MNFPVCVIIPCHNAQQWLPGTLASVAAQTHRPDQVILIADRCSDDSVKIAREFDLPIDVHESDFGNAASARNLGIEHANCPWIALLDADDQWYPHHLANAAQLLANTDHVAYCAKYDLMDNADHRRTLTDFEALHFAQSQTQLSHIDYTDLMLKHIPFGHLTVIYRRDHIREVGGFNPSFIRRHDIDLWLRAIYNHTWAFQSQVAASYRDQTPGAISRNRVEVAYYEMLAMVTNQKQYQCPQLDQLIQGYARQAMSAALLQADKPWAAKLRELAWPHLDRKYKRIYATLGLCPPLLRSLVHLKRKLSGAGTPTITTDMKEVV
ncbi:MAG: hypothetical protein CMJ19_23075 [Phycisphaeraceae bacterium]|nr:hypothetical protein [Phycisphaeraceae bacterium]